MVPCSPDQPGDRNGSPIEPGWFDAGLITDIQVGHARYAEVSGRGVCIVRLSETDVAVFDDACPHAGASLSGGRVYDQCLVCPWHAWEFRIRDGRCPDNEAIAVRKHEARVINGRIHCRIDRTTLGPTDPRARF